MLKKSLGIKLFLLFFASFMCFAQEEPAGFWSGIGKVASFGKPFWADMHSTIIRVEAAYATNSPDYDWGQHNESYRPYIFANLGVDIPLWAGNFADGKYGFSLTMPYSLDVWYDRFEPKTSPVINTSFRFSAFDACFIYRLDDPVQVFSHFNIYNWAVKFSLFKHESTHLGDELTIYRRDRKDIDMPVTRVDVLYNYTELIFILNDPDNQYRQNHGFRFGALLSHSFNDGWYVTLDSEADSDFVKPAKFPFEFFMQYQYQSALFSKGFQIIGSAEWRLRQRYKYPYSYSGSLKNSYLNDNSDLVNCFNFFAGIRYDNQKANYFSKIGLGARYYIGINPYGQFRSMPHFSQWGIAVLFE